MNYLGDNIVKILICFLGIYFIYNGIQGLIEGLTTGEMTVYSRGGGRSTFQYPNFIYVAACSILSGVALVIYFIQEQIKYIKEK
ncbi:hypothetical protein [Longirhabdus pacifica]|uniref:hypothetical protein n=1 Tax=Longirhabdus pacifica TaxID=2305227 RepID=UPI0010092FB9|nr:hypothetical protein [Longirhabdus pacifica]